MFSFPTTNGRTRRFDKFAFVKYMKYVGRAYRKQAMELVSLCRAFSEGQKQSPDPAATDRLRSALDAVDEALGSAAGVKKKTSEEVDQAFKNAIKVLARYEEDFHPKRMVYEKRTVNGRMAAAKAEDIAFSANSGFFKELFSPKVKLPKPTEVEFLLLKSLTDSRPIIVKQMLCSESKLPEVLWNFSRYKGDERLTLKQNPHFYKFPDTPRYDGEFRAYPIEDFQHEKIWVITDSDKPSRIVLKTPKHSRAFGNVWRVPSNHGNNPIIFKDVCGKLEGENVVHTSISDHLRNLATSSTTSYAPGVLFRDWRDPIRRRLSGGQKTETNICISAIVRLTGNSSPSSSLTPPAGSGANSSSNRITSQPSYIDTQRTPPCTYIVMWCVLEMGVLGGPSGTKGA